MRLLTKIADFIRGLHPAVLITAGVLVFGGLVASSLYAYHLYNYVQHDNDFCLTCHLMKDPYERFARSAHRDLGCKACHQPTPIARAKMALTQIVENPSVLQTHAEVPNERCESCHVKGNPQEWKIIAQTAGHRVHLQSPKLRGLQCVQCHSVSLHEFSSVDRTCGQSGCHAGVRVRLGKMSNLTLHCAACHDFTRPVTQTTAANPSAIRLALRPESRDCLSCHAMRQRVQMPPDEPHHGACGACHNPHTQQTPHEAVKSCASSACHSSPENITPMHRGLPVGTLADCTSCHKAHTFRITAATTQQCSTCHPSVPERPGFPHARHAQVGCTTCHSNTQKHGALTVSAPTQCQSCHHQSDVAKNCTACHAASEYAGKTYPTTQRMAIANTVKTRQLAFDHRLHPNVACAECHKESPTRKAVDVECKSCHAPHHTATSSCITCHAPPSERVHNRNVHVGCAGSSCHKALPAPIAAVPHTRQFCLACHQTMVKHHVEGNCADCHKLPPARGTAQ